MQFSFGKGVMAGAAGAAVVLTITAAGTGAAVEAVFRLGHVNRVNSTSTLTGTNRSPMLTVTNSGRGTALNLHVGKGHAPLAVNSSTVVRNLNASLLGGMAPAAFVQGGGHVRASQVTLSVNQSAALLTLPGYGTFSARCNTGPEPIAVFTPDPNPVRLWEDVLSNAGDNVTEQELPAGTALSQADLSLPTIASFTILEESSIAQNQHVATAKVVEVPSGSDCIIGVTAYGAP